MSETKLLPCPFCGGEAEYDQKTEFDHHGDMYTSHFVWCPYPTGGCGVRVYAKSKSEVTKLWNIRKPIDDIVADLEEKTDFLKDCTKYGNEDAKQQGKSYSTMMMYEVSDLVDDLIDIVRNAGKGGAE